MNSMNPLKQFFPTFYDIFHYIVSFRLQNPKASKENDAMSTVDCFVVLVGDDYSKSMSFHVSNVDWCVFYPMSFDEIEFL